MHIAFKISPILMVFLLISFSTIYGSNFTPSYGQISLVPDNSLIAQTTDCITSMMTSALIGINSDCTDNLNKLESTDPDKAPNSTTTSVSSSDKAPNSTTTSVSSSDKAPNSTTTFVSSSSSSNPHNLSKNNPFYHEFQSKNIVDGDVSTPTFTSDSSNIANGDYMDTFLKSPPQDKPSTFLKSPPQDKPSTLPELQQQNMNQPVSNPYSFQSFHKSINKNIYTNPTNSELAESLDGKNKHSKEISACFDRAFSIDNYLSDSEIIECAKDRDSYSQNSIHNYALSDNIKNNDDDNDGKSDNKHSKEISACFDRAFSIDNYLSDSEIIECAKDRDSFK
ncbi:MAG TPA: hypothetical protein VJL78_01995 [Candidatus Nitrosocosmicus sp.]|nr:hypothetical protein [Candidatus Nitrosocosmicus sp.]